MAPIRVCSIPAGIPYILAEREQQRSGNPTYQDLVTKTNSGFRFPRELRLKSVGCRVHPNLWVSLPQEEQVTKLGGVEVHLCEALQNFWTRDVI